MSKGRPNAKPPWGNVGLESHNRCRARKRKLSDVLTELLDVEGVVKGRRIPKDLGSPSAKSLRHLIGGKPDAYLDEGLPACRSSVSWHCVLGIPLPAWATQQLHDQTHGRCHDGYAPVPAVLFGKQRNPVVQQLWSPAEITHHVPHDA